MYTPDVLDRRFALRHEPSVAAQLRVWWNCAQNLVRDKQAQQAGTRPARQAGAKAKKPPKQQAVPSLKSSTSSRADRLGEQEYFAIFLKVYKLMMPAEDYVVSEARLAVREDWVTDCGPRGFLTRDTFIDALFELADVWTLTTDASEYHGFLKALHDKITKDGEFLDDAALVAGAGKPDGFDEAMEEAEREEAAAEAKVGPCVAESDLAARGVSGSA